MGTKAAVGGLWDVDYILRLTCDVAFSMVHLVVGLRKRSERVHDTHAPAPWRSK